MLPVSLLMTALLIVLISYLVSQVKEQAARFNERFPPISDAGFLARCSAGTNPQVALRVRRIVAHNLGVNYRQIYPSTNFTEDLGVD